MDELGRKLAEELWIGGINWLIGASLVYVIGSMLFGTRHFNVTLKQDKDKEGS